MVVRRRGSIQDVPSFLDAANRGIRSKRRHIRFVGESPFGPRLRLRRFELGNGLRICTVVDKAAPVVAYHTWYRVGSRHESPGKTGLAHLLEHLMFSATKTRPAGEFDALLERAGAESNAATWTDWTCYYENLPHRYLELAIELEADRMANLVLKQAQVASEKEVVANERMYRVDDDVEGTATEKLYATAFRKHPYRWPTIGWMDDIRGLTKEDCLQFYRRYYAPNNAVVIVVGDFDEQTALEGIREHYGTYRAANLPEEHTVRETALRRTKPLQLFLPASTEKVQLGYRAPPFGHPDHVPFTLAHEVLFGGRASRIYRQLVNEQELASECRASIAPFVYAGLYEVWLSARPGQRGNAMLEIFDQEVDRITRVGVDAEELDRVKNRYELFLLQSLDSVGGKAEQIGFYETVLGTSEGPFERLEAIRQVTSKSVQRVCKKYLRPAGRVLLEVFPEEQAA